MLNLADLPYNWRSGSEAPYEPSGEFLHAIWVRQTIGYIQGAFPLPVKSIAAVINVVGFMAAWICDYVQAFPAELELVWRAKWSTGKVSYLFVRYCTWPLGIVVTIYGFEQSQPHSLWGPYSGWTNGEQWDSGTLGTLRAFLYGGTAVTQFIFAVRTWAIWQRARWIKILLTTLFCTVWAFEICFSFIIIIESSGSFYDPHADPNVDIPNFVVEHSLLAMASWLPIALIDIVLMIFTILKVVRQLRYWSSSTTLIRVVRQDGILYFVAVTVVSVAYPLGEFLSGIAADITLLVGVQYCLYSAMACRAILNLRAAAANTDDRGQTTWTSPSLHFAAARGNTGEIDSREGAPEDKTTAWFGHGLSAEPTSPSSVLVIGPE